MLSRRQFLRTSLAVPAFLGGLASHSARSANTDRYKALVCVFLYGGLDCHDTVIPWDNASYIEWASIRQTLLGAYARQSTLSSRSRDALLPLVHANTALADRQFALPPQLDALHKLYERGHAALIGNVGPLHEPVNRDQLMSGAASLPPRLYSHNDQQSVWMSFGPEGTQTGWGGHFGDAASSGDVPFAQVSLSGNAVFLSGQQVTPFHLSSSGVPSLYALDGTEGEIREKLRSHFLFSGMTRNNLLQRDLMAMNRKALLNNEAMSAALDHGDAINTPFPATGLGKQLYTVAKTIAARSELDVNRQVFFVALGGFDTHSAQATELPALQQQLSEAMAAFFTATEELGIANQVTSFTASDFGRTLTVNGDGTDHGWDSHQIMLGGAVKGGNIYGHIPPSVLGHSQDAGNGRLIPQMAVEQYAEALGRWFGLDDQELALALPGLKNFPRSSLGIF